MSKDEKMSATKAVALVTIIFLGVPVGWWLRAWAIQDLWTWFVVTLPFGIPALTKAHALGLSFIVPALAPKPMMDGVEKLQRRHDCDWTQDEKFWRLMGTVILAPVAMWCVGWLGHVFIVWWWA